MSVAKTTIETLDGQTVDFPAKLVTVKQLEDKNQGLQGRVRGYLVRADWGQPDYVGLRDAIVRIGRSVYIDEPLFFRWIESHRASAPAAPRNPHGRAGKRAP